eukprot:TRINITY_DN1183_c0_g1_i1.p1 TRINITY_DN1183_c0_g1~~TRINITY_DN1183_c0_g1_i1.p1  ORF type:complete len:300 (+),score=31.75 TRINITY_DN1183_c0_g1_i1:856-1755(+)
MKLVSTQSTGKIKMCYTISSLFLIVLLPCAIYGQSYAYVFSDLFGNTYGVDLTTRGLYKWTDDGTNQWAHNRPSLISIVPASLFANAYKVFSGDSDLFYILYGDGKLKSLQFKKGTAKEKLVATNFPCFRNHFAYGSYVYGIDDKGVLYYWKFNTNSINSGVLRTDMPLSITTVGYNGKVIYCINVVSFNADLYVFPTPSLTSVSAGHIITSTFGYKLLMCTKNDKFYTINTSGDLRSFVDTYQNGNNPVDDILLTSTLLGIAVIPSDDPIVGITVNIGPEGETEQQRQNRILSSPILA